jgi:putative tryptophan/tyrosine transport system substrate-binding protein
MRQWAIVNGRKFVNRKLVISLLGTLFLASVYPAEAGQAKVYRIGALFPGGPLSETIDGLRGGSRELGLEEAKQFTLAILDTKGDANAAEEAARKFEQEKFDLIYAVTIPIVTSAKAATTNIPVVFCVGTDPVAKGLVDSFARPGGRLTGVYFLVTDLTAKRLEILKDSSEAQSRGNLLQSRRPYCPGSSQIGARGGRAPRAQVY